MLVTEVDVINPQHRVGEKIAALLDTESEKSFIIEKVARNIKLIPIITRRLSLYTFGKSKPKLISSAVYEIEVKGNEKTKTLQVNSILSITPPLKRRNGERENRLNEEWKHIDLLIGSDYFWNLLAEIKVTPLLDRYYKI